MSKIAPRIRPGFRMAFRLILPLLCVLAAPVASHASSLELDDCRISAGPAFPTLKARCGTFQRPEDPDDPASAPLELRVAVVAALDLEPEPDAFVPLAGGPGQGAVQFYSAYAGAFEHVRRSRDILLVDQRGTGESSPMDCPVDDTLIEGQYTVDQTVEFTEACLLQLPHDPRFFTTSVAVRDLDAVREALGYPQLNLYGVSYGSRVAQHYARRYPEFTRSIILDGVVPPQVPLGTEIAIEAQIAVERIFARCSEDEACATRFPSLPDEFASLRERLEREPAIVELQNPVTSRPESVDFGSAQFSAAIRLLAYNQSSIAVLPLMISEAANGNYIPLAAQFQIILEDLSDSLALGMHNSIMCSEDAPRFANFDVDRQGLEASYIGAMQFDAIEAICSIWPAGPVDDGFHQPLDTDIPVLLLSGDADPITPPRYAELAADKLENSRHLIGIDQGHGQAIIGCMPRIIADFIGGLAPQALEADCMERSFAMPFFLDFSGPQP